VHDAEVDLAAVEVDAADLHAHARADRVADAGALAAQFLAHLVEAEVLAAELGDVHQPVDIERVERDEEPEARDRADRAGEFLAEALAHEAALQPRLDVTRGLVGAALVGAAVVARADPVLHLVRGGLRRRRAELAHRHAAAAAVAIAVGQRLQVIALACEDALDHAVHEQVGIAPDRAREVRVVLVGEPEVPAVDRRVDRLLHRAQQHGVDLLGVDAVLRRIGDGLEVARLRVVADAQPQPEGAQVVLQRDLLLRRRALVHAIQRGMLVARDEVGRADVGREHGLLDEAVRVGARAGGRCARCGRCRRR
jgi:hypothetical protein